MTTRPRATSSADTSRGTFEIFHIGGNIGGRYSSTTGTWIPGHDTAPVSGDTTTEPQYGWFHNTINGLDVVGDIAELTVAGALQDLRITGTLTHAVIDSDNKHQTAGDWDGVCGVVWTSVALDYIDVGDGLADDGTSDLAVAAIMSGGSIGTVYVSGPFYSVAPPVNAGPNTTLREDTVYGQLNGTIAAIGTIDRVEGVNGAALTAIVFVGDLTAFICFQGGWLNSLTNGINTVTFTGTGAIIDGSEMSGAWVDYVAATNGAMGIFDSYISGHAGVANGDTIGVVEASGMGIYYTVFSANGARIGAIRGLGATGDLYGNSVTGTGALGEFSGRDLTYNDVHITGTTDRIRASRDILESTFQGGAVTSVYAGRHVDTAVFDFASRVSTFVVKGAYTDTILTVQGPNGSELGTLDVVLNIGGEVTCAGSIGKIISRQGMILADIKTTTEDSQWGADVGTIQAEQGIFGAIELAGSLTNLISYASLGSDPSQTGYTQQFNIQGDLTKLYVRSRQKGVTSDLYADINVGGNVSIVDVDGSLYGHLWTNGDVSKLILDGALGALLTSTDDWTGANGTVWSGDWTFIGDTAQIGLPTIVNNQGRVQGTAGANGVVLALMGNNAQDVAQEVDFTINTAGNGGMGFGLMSRCQDSAQDTYYLARLIATPGGQSLQILSVVDGVMTVLLDTGVNGASGTAYHMEFTTETQGDETALTVRLYTAGGVLLTDQTVLDATAELQGVQGRFGMFYRLDGTDRTDVDNYQAQFSRAALTVMGKINVMKFAKDQDLLANVTTGGTIKTISLTNGHLIGNITSLYGGVENVIVNGGDIRGNITGVYLGNIKSIQRTVNGLPQGGNVIGDLTATGAGGIKGVYTTGGSLIGDVSAMQGAILRISIVRGDQDADSRVEALTGIKMFSISQGDGHGEVVSHRGIDSYRVTGSDVDGRIYAETYIKSFMIDGTFSGVLRSGGEINRFQAGAIQDGVVSAAWDIDQLTVRGDVDHANPLIIPGVAAEPNYLLAGAGYDLGADGIAGTADDIYIVDDAHSGTFKNLTILGSADNTVISAGVSPGVDLDYKTTADNWAAPGESSIDRLTVRNGFTNDSGLADGVSLITYDTTLDPRFVPGPNVVVDRIDGAIVPPGGVQYFAGTHDLGNGLTLILRGPGSVWFDDTPANAQLVLDGTTSRTSVMLVQAAGTAYIKDIDVSGITNDDEAVALFKTTGDVTIADMSIDGYSKTVDVQQVAAGATWTLPGDSAMVNIRSDVADLTAVLGETRGFRVMGNYLAGGVTADAFTSSFQTTGRMNADLTTTLGDARSITVRGGSLNGDVSVRKDLKILSVRDDTTGTVKVTHGDLGTFRTGTLNGIVDVERGQAGSVSVTIGDFGSANPDASFRTQTGVKAFSVAKGDFTGVLSSDWDIRSLKVGGLYSGRTRSGHDLYAVQTGSFVDGIVAAANDLRVAKINGSFSGGYLMAGLDPGDAGSGFAGVVGNLERGNVAIDIPAADTQTDIRTTPVAGSAQVDSVGTGTIRSVLITGDAGRWFDPTLFAYVYGGATIGAGVGLGADGYIGTDDDVVASTGYLLNVRVSAGIYGTGAGNEHYGFYAASNLPNVKMFSNRPFDPADNVGLGEMYSTAGTFTVTNVRVAPTYTYVDVSFNHRVNFDTVRTQLTHPGETSTYMLIASTDNVFGNADDVNVSDMVGEMSYNATTRTVRMTLAGLLTLDTLGFGTHYQLTVTDDVLDVRGFELDGEFYGTMPSGNRISGGNFIYQFDVA